MSALEWLHQPHKPVPWKSKCRKYSVGVNFHGLFQAIKSEPGKATPLGHAWPTPDEAKQEAEMDAAHA